MYKLISFYSEPDNGTYYYKHANILKKQCEQYGIDSYIEELEGTGNYFTNCRLKPQFILDCIRKFDTPVLWVDIDSSLSGKPVINTTESFLFVERPEAGYPFHAYCSYFKNDETAIKLIEEWADRCKKEIEPEAGDHSILSNLAEEWEIEWSKLVVPVNLKVAPVSEVQSKRRKPWLERERQKRRIRALQEQG